MPDMHKQQVKHECCNEENTPLAPCLLDKIRESKENPLFPTYPNDCTVDLSVRVVIFVTDLLSLFHSCSGMDIFTTLLSLADITPPADRRYDGTDATNILLKGEKNGHTVIISLFLSE